MLNLFGRGAPFLSALAAFLVAGVDHLQAGNPIRVTVPFSITQDVGAGNEVFVSGAHRDFTSAGIQPFGIKLHWSTGNVWTGAIALEAGAPVSYTYYKHAISTTTYCSGSSTAISSLVSLTVPTAATPPYSGKLIRYFSSWSTANLLFRDVTQNGTFTQVAMQRVGTGRTAGESIFEVTSIASPADEMEFVFNDGSGHYDNAPAPPAEPATRRGPGHPGPVSIARPALQLSHQPRRLHRAGGPGL